MAPPLFCGAKRAEVDQGVKGDGFALFSPGEALVELAGFSCAAVGPLVGGVEVLSAVWRLPLSSADSLREKTSSMCWA